MKSVLSLTVALGVVCLSAFGMRAVSRGTHVPAGRNHKPRIPVLVELFTSEGCSSCPSADELLKTLRRDQPDDRAVIIPLSEHVDYWNSASWKDRFSAPKFSQRQMQYVSALHLSEPYTPQMVIDGQSEFVGSDQDTALNSISNATRRKKVAVELDLGEISSASKSEGFINAKLAIGSLSGTPADAVNDVFVAVTEDNLESNVQGGENGGRTLQHTAVVRFLEKVGSIDSTDPFETHVKLNLSGYWKTRDLAVVAFVQAHHSRKVLGATIATPKLP